MDIINAFLDAQADSYVPFREVLRRRGMDFASARQGMRQFTDKYQQLAGLHHIRTDALVTACLDLTEQLQTTPDDTDLQYLYFCVMTDRGLLHPTDAHPAADEEQIQRWFRQEKQVQSLVKCAAKQADNRRKLHCLKDMLSSPTALTKDDCQQECAQIVSLTAEHTFLYGQTDTAIYRDNIESLLLRLNGEAALTAVKPYLLFAILTRKHGMMCRRAHYIPNLRAALQYQNYQIHHDNGKNFSFYQSYLELYDHLRRFYEDDPAIDHALCDGCFADLSPLSEWYYLNCEPDILFPMNVRQKVSAEMPLGFPVLRPYEDDSDCDVEAFETEQRAVCKAWDAAIGDAAADQVLQTLSRKQDIRAIAEALPGSDRFPRYAALFLYTAAENRLREQMLQIAGQF